MMQFKFVHTTRTVFEREMRKDEQAPITEWLYLGTYKQCGITDAMVEHEQIQKASRYSASLLEFET